MEEKLPQLREPCTCVTIYEDGVYNPLECAVCIAYREQEGGFVPRKRRTYNRQNKTHCINGHDYIEENRYYRKDGSHICKLCRQERARKETAKRRAENATCILTTQQRSLPTQS